MTRENFVICNRCKERVKPPMNAGWIAILRIAPDGLNFSDVLADLCQECGEELEQWVLKGKSNLHLA